MPRPNLIDTDEEEDRSPERHSRSRSRSPGRHARSRSTSPVSPRDENVDISNLTPDSKKLKLIVEAVVDAKLAPVKRSINKLIENSSQTKGYTEQNKKSLADLKRSTNTIDERLKKIAKADPRSTMTDFAVTKMNQLVFEALKKGKKKEDVQISVVDGLRHQDAIEAADEDGVKSVAAKEFSHLKAYLRTKIKEDLSAGNDQDLPTAEKYLKSHLKLDTVDEDSLQYLTIMALGVAKFENMKPVPLSESEKENKKNMNQDINLWWEWVHKKFKKYEQDGHKLDGKLKSVIAAAGFKPRKSEGAVRPAN